MEEYLQYMKTLRSQMNDVEDQAAKVSVEEQMQLTTIQTLENDLNSAISETKQFMEDIEQMKNAKGQVCSLILEKQRKIASLESDSSTLIQTLELIEQERINLSSKLIEKSTHYMKVREDVNAKLQLQQDWVYSHCTHMELGEHGMVKDRFDEKEFQGKASFDNHLSMDNQMKQAIEQVNLRESDFKPELRAMDIKTLEEEYNALLSDKAGETEYLKTLQDQIEKLRVVKCTCGEEYKVEVGICA
ncbi:unnamed protein product [Malus baccata var. baccata]